jgi:hypothetical protein
LLSNWNVPLPTRILGTIAEEREIDTMNPVGLPSRIPDRREAILGGCGENLRRNDVPAQWGDARAALGWLATAERTRSSALETIKIAPLLDPIRDEPAFKALEQRLNFPP